MVIIALDFKDMETSLNFLDKFNESLYVKLGYPVMEEEKEMSRKEKLTQTSVPVKASLIIMGMGQLLYRQWVKGLVYLTVLVLTCFYMVTTGICDIVGLVLVLATD